MPVPVGEALGAVLIGCTVDGAPPEVEDVEALQALAAVAGVALTDARDVQRERLSGEEQARAALTDPLTGLANRRHAARILATLREGDSLALVDLDHFRGVNERLGHQGGDNVLTAFAAHLTAGVRAGELAVRYGGEEFLLILPGCDLNEATRVVERLGTTWRARRPVTTFSAGLACLQQGDSAEDALCRADAALYTSKHAGRDRVRAAGLEALAAA